MNTTISSNTRHKTASDDVTGGSNSSTFLHELLDHGLDFIKNGNTNSSQGNSVKNVKYHNEALQNKGLGKRISHHE